MTAALDIAMLGPSGAGKTSLLASLYARFPDVTRSTGLVLAAKDSATSAELSRYRRDLEAIGRELVVREAGIPGTRSFREHRFSLRDQGDSAGSHIDLIFSDYPGGWLTSPDAAPSHFQERLDETDILLVAIDTPALMAERGRLHHEVNRPQLIADVLKKWTLKRRRLLLLVPLKCEAWTGDSDGVKAVADEVLEQYSDALSAVWASPTSPAVVVCPVRTVGSLVFDRYEFHGGVTTAKFRGRRPGLKYSPEWTAEPLRLIVAATLEKQQKSRGWWKEITDQLTGDGGHLRRALDELDEQELGPSFVVECHLA